jgi:hypothetical protein
MEHKFEFLKTQDIDLYEIDQKLQIKMVQEIIFIMIDEYEK